METLKSSVISSIEEVLAKETLDIDQLNALSGLLNIIVNAPTRTSTPD